MTDEPPGLEVAAINELRRLMRYKRVETGLAAISPRGLIAFISAAIDLERGVSGDRWAAVVARALSETAHLGRVAVLARDNIEFAAELEPPYIVAAAGELLGLTDEEVFQRLLGRTGNRDTWIDAKNRKDNQGLTRSRWLRASLWVDLSGSTLRKEYSHKLLGSFLSAISDYATNPEHQSELKKLAVPAVSRVKPSAEPSPPGPKKFQPPDSFMPFRAAVPPPIGDRNLRQTADRLALQVRGQLEEKQQQNRPHNQPFSEYPLIAMRWELVGKPLSSDLGLTAIAFRPASVGDSFKLPDAVGGLADLMQAAPQGRLVILGAAGAGKSTLVTQLALELLAARKRDGAGVIPLMIKLASWRSDQKSLNTWLAQQLNDRYPFLKEDGVAYEQQLLDGEHILPIFDGFDEVAEPLREVLIEIIKHSNTRFIVTSRESEYASTIDVAGPLHGAAVMILKSLELSEIENYLVEVPVSESRHAEAWRPVFEQIRRRESAPACKELLEALDTPLMVTLAKEVYSVNGNPIELLDTEQYPNEGAIKNHLLGRYVPSRFTIPSDYQPAEAERWLSFLAAVLTSQRSDELAWWRLNIRMFDTPVSNLLKALYSTFAFSFMIMVPMLFTRWSVATDIVSGLGLCSFSIGIMLVYTLEVEPRAFRRWPSTRSLATRELAHPKIAAVPVYFAVAASILAAVPSENIFAFILSFVSIGVPLLCSRPGHVNAEPPSRLLRMDQNVALIRVLPFSVTAIGIGITDWLVKDNLTLLYFSLLSILLALLLLLSTAASRWYINTFFHARHNLLPRRTMRFLEVAHTRGILRQSGGIYQFRHALLQSHLTAVYIRDNPDNYYGIQLRGQLALSQLQEGVLNLEEATSDLRELMIRLERRGFKDAHTEIRQLLTEMLIREGMLDEAWSEISLFPDLGRSRKAIPDIQSIREYETWRLRAMYFNARGDTTRADKELSDLVAQLKRHIKNDIVRSGQAREFLLNLQQKRES